MSKKKLKAATTDTGAVIVHDELALARSAAWAWFEHGAGSDGRPVHEFEVCRTKIKPNPSRYKLEALRNAQQVSQLLPSKVSSNSLLDHYEIERISRQLDYYIESSRRVKYRDDSSGGGAVETVAEMKNKVVRRKKIGRGFWNLRYMPACGSSRDDVVEYRRFAFQRPERGGVTVVEVGGCRPQQWGFRA